VPAQHAPAGMGISVDGGRIGRSLGMMRNCAVSDPLVLGIPFLELQSTCLDGASWTGYTNLQTPSASSAGRLRSGRMPRTCRQRCGSATLAAHRSGRWRHPSARCHAQSRTTDLEGLSLCNSRILQLGRSDRKPRSCARLCLTGCVRRDRHTRLGVLRGRLRGRRDTADCTQNDRDVMVAGTHAAQSPLLADRGGPRPGRRRAAHQSAGRRDRSGAHST